MKINQTMTKEQQATINSKAYWEEVERKKQKLANQKPKAMTDKQVAFLHKLSAKY